MTQVRRRIVAGAGVLTLLWTAVGWYYSSQALAPGGIRVPEFDLEVLEVADGEVVIPATSDSLLPYVGLLPASGEWYAQVTEAGTAVTCPGHDACVRRPFTLLFGDGPLEGERVKADEYFFAPGAPELALGDIVHELSVLVEGGDAPAWWIAPTNSNVVAVLVHGRGASRTEMLRLATILVPLGHGVLIPSYTGDGVAPDPADGIGRFGVEEWVDVAMAMLSKEIPADARFVMVGASQGASLVASLLDQGDVAARVDAVILDSPLIGLDATMVLQAELAGVPSVFTRPVLEAGYFVGRLRGFNFARGEHVEFLAQDDRPLLLFHGPGDDFVPHDPSDTLAQLRADVRYERTAGVGHVRFWNADPEAYRDAVVEFLDQALA